MNFKKMAKLLDYIIKGVPKMTIKEFIHHYAKGKSITRKAIDGLLFFIFIDLFIYEVVGVILLVMWVT